MGEYLKISQAEYSRLERGLVLMDLDRLQRIAQLLGVSAMLLVSAAELATIKR